ncbi:hypothetical protein MD484_g2248, partial [Candolleomyces efflorescens]
MAAAIPETEAFIRLAVKAKPALLRPDEAGVSLRKRMQQLVYAPLKAAVEQGPMVGTPAQWSPSAWIRRFVRGASAGVAQKATTIPALARGPFLIVLDGLDECDDKEEVQELIDGMLAFFEEHPLIPVRVFITSRVELHIQARLNVSGVRLGNLADHCSDDDIATFLDVLLEDEKRRNPVIQAYIIEHGEWPAPSDIRKLIRHIGGSFIFGSTVFKFIMGLTTEPGHPKTPMDRLPLALQMSPGLDGLYAQTLARSQELPHFLHIISTIALLQDPLPTSGIAELLGIGTYEVVNVLINLQAIIQLPGTDNMPVTLFHTSLRDFLTTQTRSGPFFAHPRHHVHLFLRCLHCELNHRRCAKGAPAESTPRKFAATYALQYSEGHLRRGQHLFEARESDAAICLCRKALELFPSAPELVQTLAHVTLRHATHGGTPMDLEKAVSLTREALKLRSLSHPDRSHSLRALGDALRESYRCNGNMADLDEAISLYREVLELQPTHLPDRSRSLDNLGVALCDRYERAGAAPDIEEAISLLRGALRLRPSPHPDYSQSLNSLGSSLWLSYHHTCVASDLEESISLFREALKHRPYPHPDRPESLNELAIALHDHHEHTGTESDLVEAILLHIEALTLRPSPHPDRSESLFNLGSAFRKRHRQTGSLAHIDAAISMYREALELRPPPHPARSASLDNLGYALWTRHQQTRTITDIDEAVSMCREALELRPSPHPARSTSLTNLGKVLWGRHHQTRIKADIDEAISMCRAALELQPPPHPDRSTSLNNLANALWSRHHQTRIKADIDEAISTCREALEIQPPPDPDRSTSLNNLGNALWSRHQQTGIIADIDEAISMYYEALELRPPPHPTRSTSLNNIGNALWSRYQQTGIIADIDEAISMYREALELRPPLHPDRSTSLNNLANALWSRHQQTRIEADIDEAISVSREALKLRPSPHPDRLTSLTTLGNVLWSRHQQTRIVADIGEAISMYHEALQLRPFHHPDRPHALRGLVISLVEMCSVNPTLPFIQNAIPFCEELLAFHYLVKNEYRLEIVCHLAFFLWKRAKATQRTEEDDSYIAKLLKEARQLAISTSTT